MDRKKIGIAVAVGLLTMVLDLLFHTFLTDPNETVAYFVSKFLLATIAALIVLELDIGSLLKTAVVGGVIFTVFMSLYYGLAYYTQSPILSCCFAYPAQVWGIPTVTFFYFPGYSYPIGTFLVVETIVHTVIFAVAFWIVNYAQEEWT